MKKRVKYKPGSLRFFAVGMRVDLVPMNHPDAENVTNGELVSTSAVVDYHAAAGILETENTIYEPATA